MKKAIKLRNFIIGFAFVTILLVCLIYSTNFANAQNNDEILEIHSNFPMLEFADNINTSNGISSIDIPLPSVSWNITNIEMNFTDIKLGKEIKTIEESGQSIHRIDSRGKLGYGVEINIIEPTILFGVYIYGYITGTPVQPVYVQIQGYDIPTNSPDENILGNTVINISTPGWHQQIFEYEVSLSPGNYYLVINGSELTFPTDKSDYQWLFNDSGSINTNLHTAVYDGVVWSEEDVGKPLLHKLIQRVDRSFNPEEINMTLDIDGSLFPISGNGSITVNKNISPNSAVFNIPIDNNRSIELLFNLSFHIKLQNFLNTEGFLFIQDNPINIWTLNPEISRYYCNCSIKFIYPNSWYNITIYRNSVTGRENITSDIIKDPINHFIFLPNNTIMEDTDWEITANSPNIRLPLDLQKTKFSAGQEIKFSVLPPIPPGNITFRLINTFGYPAQPDETYVIDSIRTENLKLNYTLPSNPHEGTYKAYIFWNNATDVGVITQEFQIIIPSVPFTLDPLTIFGIVLLTVGLSAFSIISYRTIKKIRTRKIEEEQKIFSKCMDIMNLDYLIVTNKNSGLSVYEQKFAIKELNGTLISGFLQAISSFGIEIMKVENQSQTIKLEYKDSIVLMSEFVNIRLILKMKESPSKYLLSSLEDLAYEVYKNYGNMIDQFNGDVRKFKGIEDLLIKHLNVSIVYPLKLVNIDKLEKIRISPTEKSFINNAISIMNKSNTNIFYIKDLILEKTCSPKNIEIILKLIEKNIFQVAI